MNDKNQTTQSKGTRTLTQQMRQAFADWVTALPFIKKDTTRDPEREDLESESVGRAGSPQSRFRVSRAVTGQQRNKLRFGRK